MLDLSIVKILSVCIYPIVQVLLLLMAGLFFSLWRRFRAGITFVCAGTLWLWVCSMPYFATGMMSVLEKDYPPVSAENLPNADAIVLLGGAIRGEVSPDTLADMSGVGDRLVFAVAAFNAGKAPLILVTGGAAEGHTPESVLIRDILVTMGVPQERIVLETRNRVTLDNRRFTSETLKALGADSILLVTSAFHMPRAMLVFETLDIDVYSAPTDFQALNRGESTGVTIWDYLPSVKALQLTTWFFHERVGYFYYKLQN
ncbi:MAG: YdcF family protein [Halioglobus sp.]